MKRGWVRLKVHLVTIFWIFSSSEISPAALRFHPPPRITVANRHRDTSCTATWPPPRRDLHRDASSTATRPPPRRNLHRDATSTATRPPPRRDLHHRLPQGKNATVRRQRSKYCEDATSTATRPPLRHDLHRDATSTAVFLKERTLRWGDSEASTARKTATNPNRSRSRLRKLTKPKP